MKLNKLLIPTMLVYAFSTSIVAMQASSADDSMENPSIASVRGASAGPVNTQDRDFTWIAAKHYDKRALLDHVKRWVEHISSSDVIHPVPAEKGKFFGRTLPLKPGFDYPFLQFVSMRATISGVNTMEFGCSEGFLSVLVPFCFQNAGKHIGIDISGPAIDMAKTKVTPRVLTPFEL